MFISYAQNFEDVMLWRALGHVERGFYIDVGANHPTEDSVTQAFYERGWSGINIEPLAKHARQLEQERPRDINLQVAVGAENGEIELFDTPVRGLATASAIIAGRHTDAGLQTVSSIVPLRRLQDICAEHAPENIHFLKIDVEGFEAQVLAGMDLQRFRPWVLLVEATIPNTREIDASWEPEILAAGYRQVYFDGLNRYYVPLERADELAGHFSSPPNVFDAFVLSDLVNEQENSRTLAAQLGQAHAELKKMEVLAHRLDEAEQHIEAIYGSTSWRITAPLRQASEHIRQTRQWVARDGVDFFVSQAARMPRLRRMVGALARKTGTHALLLRLYHKAQGARSRMAGAFPDDHVGSLWPHVDVASMPMMPRVPEASRLHAEPPTVPAVFRITGHIEGHYSLAIVNRGLALGLEEIRPGCVAFQPWHETSYSNPTDLPAHQADALHTQIARSEAFAGRDAVSIVHHYPIINDANPARQRLIFFFWEETAIPTATIARLNAEFDGVLVAADFVRRALINSGCRTPVFIVPLGIDHLIDGNVAALGDLKPAAGNRLRFLHVSSAFERKGPDTLLRAYLDAFTGDDAVELYIKTFPNPHNRVAELLHELSSGLANPARVVIDDAPLDDNGMLALYRSAQAMVLPTRGEGFNLPAAEALALGLPLIVTGHGAHLDFATQANALLTPFRFSRSQSHVSAGNACWVSANPADLAMQMRRLRAEVESDSPNLAARRARGVEDVRSTYSWQACAAAVEKVSHWLQQAPALAEIRSLSLLSPWQTRCGIAEYSHNLLSAFLGNESWRLRVYCDTRTAEDVGQADKVVHVPSWTPGDNPSVCATLDLIAQDLPDTLLVQHQPSLFVLTPAVCSRLAALARQGCVVVLELHSTQPLLSEHRLSAQSLAALRQIDRIIVHKEDDLNYLLALGLCNNVMLLTLGVVQPLEEKKRSRRRSDFNIPDDALVIGSFGFALPHKGGDTLVAALKPLASASGRKVHLLGLNSILDARSEQTLGDWQKAARKQGVDKDTTWISDFRPIDECLDILGLADYIVFPYRNTRESASAAVTIGLATMRPVLVSPLDIFSDVAECTCTMTGYGVDDIVTSICQLEAEPARAANLLEHQARWLTERDWQHVSGRLAAMLDGLRRQRQIEAATHTAAASTAMTTTPRRLFVDISELHCRDARTGIQRVVRSVLNELFTAPPAGYEICPVFANKGQPWRHTAHFAPSGAPAQSITEGEEIVVRAGDIFLGLDLGAHLFPEAETQLHNFRLAGARVFFVVYDIIPLRYPQFTIEAIHTAFAEWLQSLARQADGLLCISAAVAEDVRQWLAENGAPLPHPDVRHFHLGADIEHSLPSRGQPDDAKVILDTLAGGPVFLSVGTIEPRKGQEQTLDAFEMLWRDGNNARLVLVGKEGWMMEPFAARLRQHSELGHRLLWLEGISDEFLEEIYAKADCLIAGSQTEGFGLPLIEAAQHDLPIIARDIPVFREIAGSHAFYFSGKRPEDLAKALYRWLESRARGTAPASSGMGWLTWKESTTILKDILLEDVD
ncbi:FkbM family methyltransferase [Stutzerimonas stutzeri]|uniref:FkbM family methyltransferase n=1 Tax=Stutzerimonas stutzeri TaxID=316 RepID=UPI0015E42A3C|nr:FkbM family methyltransferase [Stutzerimonas stutzeri]MBA1264979.1 FkbM family methyltransferase [Stutzerimonas stutzeri]